MRWCVGVALLLSISSMVFLGFKQRRLIENYLIDNRENVIGCVGWRETNFCHPYGVRIPHLDKPCSATIQGGAGYCLCEGGRTTARMICGPHHFTCHDKCAELTWDPSSEQRLPEPFQCSPEVPLYDRARFFNDTRPASWHVELDPLNNQANKLWDRIDDAFTACGSDTITPPGIRTEKKDWVWDGKAMSWNNIRQARMQWHRFMAKTPAYPTSMFKGRGIVIVGGGMKYFLPAWVTVNMIRLVGCKLPIEMWFPVTEYPTQAMEEVLSELGVSCRRLYMRNLEQKGFSIKAAAIIMSRFQEVVFLDSDNLPIRDPSILFDSQQYKDTGAILWPDFWDSYAAPEAAQVLGIPSKDMPTISFESGQMVIDKSRHWKGLMMSIFMNEYHALYYELLTSYMGKGDKDTFAYAFLSQREPFHTVPVPVAGLGTFRVECRSPSHCVDTFWGNTMVQHDTQGEVLFLHTNMPPKWSLNLPAHFSDYQRRWLHLKPQNIDFIKYVKKITGFDLEHEIYHLLRAFKCSPFFQTYYKSRLRMGDPIQPDLDGFHPIVDGINFRLHYRKGVSGAIKPFLSASMADHYRYFTRGPWRRFKARVRHYMRQNVL